MNSFPTDGSASFDFLVEDPDGSLAFLWQGTPGTVVTRDGAFTVVRVQAGVVTLPVFDMPALSARASRVEYSLPSGAGQHAVVLRHILNDQEVGGMQFVLRAPDLPR
jgi:hypothetical protein